MTDFYTVIQYINIKERKAETYNVDVSEFNTNGDSTFDEAEKGVLSNILVKKGFNISPIFGVMSEEELFKKSLKKDSFRSFKDFNENVANGALNIPTKETKASDSQVEGSQEEKPNIFLDIADRNSFGGNLNPIQQSAVLNVLFDVIINNDFDYYIGLGKVSDETEKFFDSYYKYIDENPKIKEEDKELAKKLFRKEDKDGYLYAFINKEVFNKLIEKGYLNIELAEFTEKERKIFGARFKSKFAVADKKKNLVQPSITQNPPPERKLNIFVDIFDLNENSFGYYLGFAQQSSLFLAFLEAIKNNDFDYSISLDKKEKLLNAYYKYVEENPKIPKEDKELVKKLFRKEEDADGYLYAFINREVFNELIKKGYLNFDFAEFTKEERKFFGSERRAIFIEADLKKNPVGTSTQTPMKKNPNILVDIVNPNKEMGSWISRKDDILGLFFSTYIRTTSIVRDLNIPKIEFNDDEELKRFSADWENYVKQNIEDPTDQKDVLYLFYFTETKEAKKYSKNPDNAKPYISINTNTLENLSFFGNFINYYFSEEEQKIVGDRWKKAFDRYNNRKPEPSIFD